MKKISFLLMIFVLSICLFACGNGLDLDDPYLPEHKTDTSRHTDSTEDVGTTNIESTDAESSTEQSSNTQDTSTDNKESDEGKEPTYDYNIIYDLNGGHFDGKVPNGYISSKGAEIDIKPVREGYKFFGWINKNSGECVDKITIEKNKKGNYEFYAIWYTDIDENGFVLRNDGEAYTLVWYKGDKKDRAYIPDSFNSLSVTKIDSYAFYYRSDLDGLRLTIPTSINELGSYVFEKAGGLELYLWNEQGICSSASEELKEWVENLTTDETNTQAIEVIEGLRPAIGFSKWF